MIVAVHQPQYLPWSGYFHKIHKCDCFVFLDRVQYKDREFQNRNKIRTKDGWMWLTVPVLKKQQSYPDISDVYIDNSQDWPKKHWRAICLNYAKTQFFKQYSDFFQDLYKKEWKRLIELNMYIIKNINHFLGLKQTICLQSQFTIQSKSTQRIIELCKILKADTYLSGIGGKDYLEEGLFSKNGIKLIYQDFRHPEYKQCFPSFIPFMSIIDLLFNYGKDASKILFSNK